MSYLVDVLVWVLATFGMTTIIVNSTVMLPVRNVVSKVSPFLGKLINCILCMGFWVGVFWGVLSFNPFEQYHSSIFLDLLFAGCVGSATSWLIYLKFYNLMKDH